MDFFLLLFIFKFAADLRDRGCCSIMASDNRNNNDEFDDRWEREDPPWDEEEEDQRRLYGDSRSSRRFHDRSRSRSPVSQSRVRSSVHYADSNIEARIDEKLDAKFDSFLAKVRDAVGPSSSNAAPTDGALCGQMESLVLTQKELKRQQLASSMKTDGGRYQFLALSEVKTKIEGAEQILKNAIGKSVPMSASQTIELSQYLEDARSLLDKRMDLVFRADTLPSGFKVLTAYQKRLQETERSSDPEQEKLWSEVAKQIENEKKAKEAFAKKKFASSHGNQNRRGNNNLFPQVLIFCLCYS